MLKLADEIIAIFFSQSCSFKRILMFYKIIYAFITTLFSLLFSFLLFTYTLSYRRLKLFLYVFFLVAIFMKYI